MTGSDSKNQTEFGWEGTKNPTKAKLLHIRAAIDRDLEREYESNFQLIKKEVIDYAFSRLSIDTVAELGCVWGVNGAYGRYIADVYQPKKVTMVDLLWNERALGLCRQHAPIETMIANFCDDSTVANRNNTDM